MPLVEIKDFDVLIDNKPFFDQLVKNKQEAYEKIVEASRNDDCTTESWYHQETMIIQQKAGTTKNIIPILVQIYQEKQIQVFLNKLSL